MSIRKLTSQQYQFDSLTSPLFKKSWFDPPFKPLIQDSELLATRDELSGSRRNSDCFAVGNELHAWDFPLFRETPATNIPELLPQGNENSVDEEDTFSLDVTKYQIANFCLEKDVRRALAESKDYSESERRKLLCILNMKLKKGSSVDKSAAIKRYMQKKQRRKFVCQVKYKVRQDLACKRLRVKGKFVKSSKMDLMTAANILMSSLNRKPCFSSA
jgi:hypothetical protein